MIIPARRQGLIDKRYWGMEQGIEGNSME